MSPKIYSSIEAAAEVGTTPRLLRRFLRANDSWKNATQAGRYSFDEAELKSLKVQFDHWQRTRISRPQIRTRNQDSELTHLDQDPGISVEEMLRVPRDPALRSKVLERRLKRHRRLNERLNQMRREESIAV